MSPFQIRYTVLSNLSIGFGINDVWGKECITNLYNRTKIKTTLDGAGLDFMHCLKGANQNVAVSDVSTCTAILHDV